MPKIPTYDNFQDVAQESPNARFDRLSDSVSPGAESVGANEMVRTGDAMQQAGQRVTSDAIDAQNMANQVRVNDAMNQAREAAMALQYDPQNGFLQQKGAQAFNRDSGKPLADEYTEQLQQHINDLSSGLGNDAQRRMFMENAGQLTSQFYGAAMQHEAQEFHTYSVSVQDGTIAVSQDAIGKNWNNPDVVQQNTDAIYAAAYQKAQLTGHSATEAQELAQKEASKGHVIALSNAIQNGNFDYANQYIQKFGKNMDADDLMRISGILTKQSDGQLAMSTAQQVFKDGMAGANPQPTVQFANILKQVESGGKRYDANGNLLTSSAGAQGEMQVMPATAKDPGLGVKPAQDNSPEELARVGRDYAAALVARYGGDQAKAAAAYNGGMGRVDAAIKAATAEGNPNNWLSHMPAETQAYVPKVMAQVSASMTPRATLPPLADMEQKIRDSMPNARPQAVQMAITQLHQMYTAQQQQQKAQEDQAVSSAITFGANNRGDFDLAQKTGILTNVPADKLGQVMDAYKRFQQGVNVDNNQVYAKLADPDTLKNLTQDQLMSYQGELSSHTFQHFVNEWQKLQSGSARDTALDLDRRGLNDLLGERLRQMGINMGNALSGKDKQNAPYVAALTQYVHESVLDQQQNTGKKMQYGDMKNYVDQLFARNLFFHNTQMFGGYGPTYPQQMLGMHPGDIPPDSRTQIYKQLQSQGIQNPTDAQILNAYWKGKK